ncbi:hypothetical protein SMACR_08862 [Sordaria macrospora]|uniref:WGS project CABT00000000 data, contig 2.67 n=2 Tax=Sordaria macrospora TaxID=5147 RepID=F7WAY3_SORMK|nr:uncharacterized protein SMAC_08862 [Sordaria macrospora k-hell]KAA8628356.1 hypothetical protein SMACR_08862 [Sordaria macrospora]KAH7635812.1 hypothetical protein B0T09DRAFT_253597 [Sordaria sp. MPI-SDFR-AT-0083]WPJ64290.1 hypothetical protein SMAC4_08862 [Sordaria macrospora]CCC14298.1 unnamed protein product [Sordaria macrospora k-hell]
MNSLSPTLRSEPRLLGVRVNIAVIGVVHTPMIGHPLRDEQSRLAGRFVLPAAEVFGRISDTRKGLAQPRSMVVNVVARSTISDIESGKNGDLAWWHVIFD